MYISTAYKISARSAVSGKMVYRALQTDKGNAVQAGCSCKPHVIAKL